LALAPNDFSIDVPIIALTYIKMLEVMSTNNIFYYMSVFKMETMWYFDVHKNPCELPLQCSLSNLCKYYDK